MHRHCGFPLRRTLLVCSLFCTGMLQASVMAQVELLGTSRISGETSDLSGLNGQLETNTPANAFGGLSALEYSGQGNVYLALSDRGPGDGAASFPCRFHKMAIDVDPLNSDSAKRIRWKLLSTHLFKSATGDSLTGSLANLRNWNRAGHCPSMDPEGIRLLGSDEVLVSDEYGPSIQLFGLDGKFRRSLSVPDKFALSEFQKPAMSRGTFPNRGLEGLCVSPDRSMIVGAMQGPLVQDGRIENNKCYGIHTRWIAIDTKTNQCREYVYDLDNESTGISEILAIDNQRFLVLERDSSIGEQAKVKRIYLATLGKATDVSSIESLSGDVLQRVVTVKKEAFLDLMEPRFGLSGSVTPEKPEGITWGPRLPDGRRLLMVSFDNDFEPQIDSILAAFAIQGLD